MSVIDSINDTTAKALDFGENYIAKSGAYYRLKIFQQLTISFSFFFKLIVLGSLIFLGMIFLTVAGSMALGDYLESLPLACVIIAGVLFLIALMIYILRKNIDKKVIEKLSTTFFDEE
ncbi:hypothetical protein U1E44_14495 [Arenibacter sp. GZD96]|uniref:hypothetical protein n=1 Tax=Aurantibrevibacter litoralis TaxID=3106030 RepID=UPI002AFFF9FC|nr:hypothetical protein [Arenibacter sp. GZD-96]MEA1787308.1 hypothetical protein [Arenibacter sp. GZD-96]